MTSDGRDRRRLALQALGYMMVPVGVFIVTAYTIFGIPVESTFASVSLNCGTPSAYPECAQVPLQFDEIYLAMAIGAAMAAGGLYLALTATRQRPTSARRSVDL